MRVIFSRIFRRIWFILEKTWVIIVGIGLLIVNVLGGIVIGFMDTIEEVIEYWDNVEKPKDIREDSNESDSQIFNQKRKT